MPHDKRYLVYLGDELVLEIVNQPGPLVSRKVPPPNPHDKVIMHPFLSATAFVPEHEQVLRAALQQSHNLSDYLLRLKQLGFRVVESPN